MTMLPAAQSALAPMLAKGWTLIDHVPHESDIRSGARVHHQGERYGAALNQGTATVVAVMRRGSDECPDSWERSYGRPNVEVLVESDRYEEGTYRWWADYHTSLAHEQGNVS